jgi:hypothetical protein
MVGGVHSFALCAMLFPLLFCEENELGIVRVMGKERRTRIYGSEVVD